MNEETQVRRWTVGGASIRGVPRPDGRLQVRLPEDCPEAWQALAEVAARSAGAALLVHRSGDDPAQVKSALRAAGFRPARTETLWRIPIPHLAVLGRRSPHRFVPVTELDPAAVAELDNAVRADIPGTDGWLGTAAELRATLADPEFDPELYLVAQHTESGSLDGLIRVWNRRPDPRLGCWGVRRPWRRTSLAPALVAALAATLRTRGSTHVVTETDETNVASSLAAANHGGIQTGTLVEWERLL